MRVSNGQNLRLMKETGYENDWIIGSSNALNGM